MPRRQESGGFEAYGQEGEEISSAAGSMPLRGFS